MLKPCEIIYVKQAKGWKWRSQSEPGAEPGAHQTQTSEETFELFYDCVTAARARGYNPPVKCK